MSRNIIDLRQYRCPMALLLAKRQCVQFFHPQQYLSQLTILVAERASLQDITNYLTTQNYTVTTTSINDGFKLVVMVNKESN